MTLRKVEKTFSLEEQRQEINEIAVDLDAINTTISNYNTTNWDTAYSWGDHAQAGYWVDNATSRGQWDAAYGWGDHAQEGYLVNGSLSSVVYRAGSDFKLIAGGSQTTRPYIHLKNTTSTDLEIVGAQSDSAGVTIDSRGSGTVKLKDGGNIRVETSNTGVTITGVLTAGGLSYPNSNGSAGEVLTSDGAGNITWSASSAYGYISGIGSTPSHGLFHDANLDQFVIKDGTKLVFGTGNPNTTGGDYWITWTSNGTSGDLVMEPNSNVQATNNVYIRSNSSGGVAILDGGSVELYHLGDKRLYTDSAGIQVVAAGVGATSGGNITCGNIVASEVIQASNQGQSGVLGTSDEWTTAYGWGDHAQAGYLTAEADTIATVVARGDTIGNDTSLKFGDAAPTQIYYDSANNVTAFESNALIFRTKTTPNEDYITCLEGGPVEFYYDGVKKLGTTLAGVSVIGDLSASGDLITPSKLIHDGDIDTYLSFDTDTIKLTTAGSERITIGSSGQLGLGGSNYGAAGEVLTSNGPTAAPSWQAPTGGGGASSTSVDLSLSLNKPSIYPVKVPIDPDANGDSTYTRQSFYEWYGGALASNGNIYGTPYGSDRILKIDTVTKTATTISVSGLTVNNQSYGGAVAHPNGKIYFTPMDEGNVLEFDPETEAMSTFGSNIPAYPTVDNGWGKGIVAPNGHIYCAPNNSNQVLKIDVTNKTATLFGDTGYIGILADPNQADGDTGSSKFCGAHLVGNKIYLTPQSANDEVVSGTSSPNQQWIVGIIDTTNDTLDVTSFKFGESELPQLDDHAGTSNNGGNYLNGNNISYVFQASVDGPDGKIYCIPYDYPWICVIDPIDNTISRMSNDPLGTVTGTGSATVIGRDDRPGSGSGYETDFQFYGGTLAANGKIYCNRKGGWNTSPAENKILEIDPATQSWKYISQPSTLADGTVVDSTFWFPVTILGPDGAIYGIPYFKNFSGTGENGGAYLLDDPLYWQPPAASLPAPWTLTINQNGVF